MLSEQFGELGRARHRYRFNGKLENSMLRRSNVDTTARLTCPSCGGVKIEGMPTDACQFFYECTFCDSVMKPKPGDCCVFCSYADRRGPPKQ